MYWNKIDSDQNGAKILKMNDNYRDAKIHDGNLGLIGHYEPCDNWKCQNI